MAKILLIALLLPLSLSAQASTGGPTAKALRVGFSVQELAPDGGGGLMRQADFRETPRWVRGGIIGGVIGTVLALGITSIFDSLDHSPAPYVKSATLGAFGGFVIGALIAGE